MDQLNYHQLRYFYAIAKAGGLNAAARQLRSSQSNLSAQLKGLEEALGHPLFERRRRRLVLTEQGRLTLDFAEAIFDQGRQLQELLGRQQGGRRRRTLRIGALSSLSKNLQLEFCLPALKDPDVQLQVVEGGLTALQARLAAHDLDVILSVIPVRVDESPGLFNHELVRMPALLVGRPPLRLPRRPMPQALEGAELLLPGRQSRLRADFEAWLEAARVRVRVKAEVEDMALLRLFALSGQGLALVPRIVVAPELKDGRLVKAASIPGLQEVFFAITASRRFPDPLVESMVRRLRRDA